MYTYETKMGEGTCVCFNLDHVTSVEHYKGSNYICVTMTDGQEREYRFASAEKADMAYLLFILEMKQAEKRGLDE